MLRESKSHGGYTLSVVYIDCRHIKILSQNGKFGFTEPVSFESIPALIAHFQKQSLKEYNAELETPLLYPYKEAPTRSAETAARDDDVGEVHYQTNRDAHRRKRAKNQRGGAYAMTGGQRYRSQV